LNFELPQGFLNGVKRLHRWNGLNGAQRLNDWNDWNRLLRYGL
jgi:hypothetical protein